MELSLKDVAKNAILVGHIPDKVWKFLYTYRAHSSNINVVDKPFIGFPEEVPQFELERCWYICLWYEFPISHPSNLWLSYFDIRHVGALFDLIPRLGATTLLPYIRLALARQIIELPTLTAELLTRYCQPIASDLGDVGILSQLILDTHYTAHEAISLAPPEIPNLLSLLKALYSAVATVHDAIVRTVSQVAILIISGVQNISAMSAADLTVSLVLCHDLMHNYHSAPDLQAALDSLTYSMSSIQGSREGLRSITSRSHVAHGLKFLKISSLAVSGSLTCTELALHISHIVRKPKSVYLSLLHEKTRYANAGQRSVVEAIVPWLLSPPISKLLPPLLSIPIINCSRPA